MRADLLLAKLGYARSRESAKKLIESGFVFIDNKKISKPSFDIDYNDGDDINIILTETPKYVSRGGYKLEGILRDAKISPKGVVCIDLGSSTGGFTDCLLQAGAKKVYCVDSGKNQLVKELAEDKRTIVLEETNARYLNDGNIPEKVDIIVTDLSFISQTLIHERVSHFLKQDGLFISLIKPQFELSRTEIKKGGIVKSKKDRHTAALRVISSCEKEGLFLYMLCDSKIKGGDGNIEYTAVFTKNKKENIDILSFIEKLS